MAAHAINARGIDRIKERHQGRSPLLVVLKDFGRNLAASWAWYRDYRHTESELSSLTDKELADIGISRWDIPSIAMESANAKNDR